MSQSIDVLQWDEDGAGVLAYRYPMADRAIRNGAALTVRDTQHALFVSEGRIADLFGPGLYRLAAQTLPVLTYLQNWNRLFELPFKSDVFFFSTRDQVDQGWRTQQPVTLRDREYGALQIHANGVYAYRIADPSAFWTRLSGTVDQYAAVEAEGPLQAAILITVAAVLGAGKVAAANLDEVSESLQAAIEPAFAAYGLELTDFRLQGLSLPEEMQAQLDHVEPPVESPPETPPTPAPALKMPRTVSLAPGIPPVSDPVTMIERLGGLLQKGILTQAEFDAKKTELLQQIR